MCVILCGVGVFARTVRHLFVELARHVARGDVKSDRFNEFEPEYLQIEVVIRQSLVQQLLVKRKIEQLLSSLRRTSRSAAYALAEKAAVYLVKILGICDVFS